MPTSRCAAGLLFVAHVVQLSAWVERSIPVSPSFVRKSPGVLGMAVSGNTAQSLVLPAVVLGTFQLKGEVVKKIVLQGIRDGARAIDTASVYRNEADIGAAIRESGVARSDLFITSKLGPSEQGYEPARQAIRSSLDRLQTDYLDLYLIHWPGSSKTPPTSPKNRENRLGSWRALEEAHEIGLVRHIGVSNFHTSHLTDLLENARIRPAVNQVEFHAEYMDKPLLRFCQEEGVLIQGYSPLGSPAGRDSLFSHAPVEQVAARLGITKAQVLIKWGVQRTNGRSVVFRTSNASRLAENLAAAEAPHLSDGDLEKLDSIAAGEGESVSAEKGQLCGDVERTPGQKYCWDAKEIA